MATITVTVDGVPPYDGSYEMDFDGALKNREWDWIKRYSGYLPATFEDALRGGDAAFWCAIALILIRRRDKITNRDADAVFEQLNEASYQAIGVVFDVTEEDDDRPPPSSSTSSTPSSGDGSPTSSETPARSPSPTGTPASATSPYDLPTLVT